MGFATHILVAFDFSDVAEVALSRAAELAKAFDAKLSVLHVHNDSVPVPAPSGRRLETSTEGDVRLKAHLAAHCAERLNGHEVHTEVLDARDVAEAICEYASDRSVDMIVAGNQGMSGIARMLMGSVAEEIVRNAPCAVLIVRAPKES